MSKALLLLWMLKKKSNQVDMKVLILTIWILLTGFMSWANSDFDKGNKAYKEQNYELAAESYEKLIEAGKESSELYYNLGNTYYKLDSLGKSKYYFEKALKLDPNNEDLQYNIDSIANPSLLDNVQYSESKGIKKAVYSVILGHSKNFWSTLGLILWISGFGLLGIYWFVKKRLLQMIGFYSAITCILVALIAITFTFMHKSHLQNHQKAVVMKSEVDILTEPSDNAEMIFQLHEGTTIELIDENKDWCRIEVDNQQGWVLKKHLALI